MHANHSRLLRPGPCLLALILLSSPTISDEPSAAEKKLAAALAKAPDAQRLAGDDPLGRFQLAPPQSPVKLTWHRDKGQVRSVEVQTHGKPEQIWSYQLAATTDKPIRKGDTLFVTFRLRARGDKPSADAMTEFVIERNAQPHEKLVTLSAYATTEWRRFSQAARAPMSLKADQISLLFRAGWQDQTYEIADLQILNFQRAVKPGELPSTGSGYRGRQADAPWRAKALARIEKIRKADLTVRVVDGQGKPVSGATVHVRQTRQSFPFGSAVAAAMLTEDSEHARTYRRKVLELFNYATIENNLKWPQWIRHRQRGINAVNWLVRNDIAVRGHCLIWPSWRRTPKHLEQLKDKPQALRKAVLDHVGDVMHTLKGKLTDVDVINEPYSNHDVMEVLGREVMLDWYQAAHQSDPKARLFLNDYGILSGAGRDRRHQDHFEQTLRYLLDNKAPLGGIGMQGHFGTTLTAPQRVLEILDRFAEIGLPIQITELDINVADRQLQADYMRDFLIATYSHPSVEAIIMWGFWESRHWRPNAALFDTDWTIRPHGEVWKQLVHEQWRTDVKGKTDSTGRYKTRGFLGRYEVTVSTSGGNERRTVELDAKGRSLTVKMP